MTCSIVGISNSLNSEDLNASRETVKKVLKMTAAERALATSAPIHVISRIIKDSNPSIDGEEVHLINVTRKAMNSFIVKYRVGDNKEIIEMALGSMSPFKTGNSSALNINSNSLEVLYSDQEYAYNNDDFEVLALDITNNPEKITEIAEYLVEADEYHNDNSYNDILLGQLSSIQEVLVDMVPVINVHINKKGESNTGRINVATGDIFIAKGIGGSKSLLEIYVHELYHAVTHFAITSKSTDVRKITARMEKVREHFLENTAEEDLVRMSGNVLTKEQASEVLDHLSNANNGLHEFVALSMSNKAVMNQLASLNMMDTEIQENRSILKILIDAVASLFHSIAKKVTGEPDSDDLSRMVFLVNKISTAHKKPLRAKKFLAIRNLISIFEPVEKKFSEYLEGKIKKATEDVSRNVPKKGEGSLKYNLRLFARSFFDDQARDLLGSVASLASFKGGIFSPLAPEGTIRTIIRDATQSDLTQDRAESLGLLSGHIDQLREFLAVQNSKVVLSYFSNKPTAEEEEMLTNILLDTDLSTVYESYDMLKLLENDLEILSVIKEKEKELEKLSDKESFNFYKAQTTLLSEYMIKGTNNIALLMNAENIAKMVDTGSDLEYVSKEIIDIIDEITTLKALKLSSKKDKVAFREMIENEPEGIRSLVAFHQGQKERALIDVFPTQSDKLKIIKGYSVQIMDPDVSIVTAPMSRAKELNAQGYKLEKALDKHSLDDNETSMGLFINHKFMETSFHRVGIRLTEKSRRGVTVTESYMSGVDNHKPHKAALAIIKMKNRKSAVISNMFEGSYNANTTPDDNLISPTLNNLGKTVDFRYGMSKESKIKYLNMERKIAAVMGRTVASTFDKKESDNFNSLMMDLILEDANKNKTKKSVIGDNLKEYVKIEKHSSNADIAALWRVLPENIKSKHSEGFFVRRDLMYTYLGYREMGVENLLGFNLINSNSDFVKNLKYILKFAEKLWQELVKISKIDIIIRTPGVFIGNVISNFMLMYASGYSMKEIIELKYQGVKELRMYTTGLKESIQLRAKLDAKLITPKELRRLNVIENNLKNSPVKDLVDAGFYTTIVEEIEHGGESGSYFNRLAKKKLKNRPKIFRDGLDLLYITENTKFFKVVEEGIQASDFAARYAQYHLMVEGGADKDFAIKTVRDNFIDYNKPNSKFIEMANKNGFMMFTKYFTRIQRVLKNYGLRHPAKLLLSVLAQDYVLGEMDDMTDQSAVVKDMGNLFYNPWDHFMRVITPSSLEAIGAAADFAFSPNSDFKP